MSVMNRRDFTKIIAAWCAALSQANHALAKLPLPSHPRLYFTADQVEELRARFKNPLMTMEVQTITNAPRPITLAFYSVMEPGAIDKLSGLPKARAAIVQSLAELAKINPKQNFQFEWLQELHQGACVYDWCYADLTEDDKLAFFDHFARLANGKDGSGFPVREPVASLVGHEAQGSILGNHLAVGIALADEHSEILSDVLRLLKNNYMAVADFLFPGIADLNGVYYARHVHFGLAQLMLHAIGSNLVFNKALAKMPYEWIHALRPDGRMLRSGDNLDDESRARKLRFSFAIIGGLYGDSNLLSMAEDGLKEAPADQPYKAPFHQFDRLSAEELVIKFIAVRPELKQRAREAQFPFGLSRILHAPEPANRMMFRTGWQLGPSESRDALVDMRIGEYFIGNHQRKDFGTFQIYYRGPLAITSGVYQGSPNSWYARPHWLEYYQQTVSSNGLLIVDPDEKPFLAGIRANDGGQRWPNKGQNHPPNLDVLLNPKNGYRMAHVLGTAAADDESYAYISGDITAAYDSKKVDLVQRAMLSIQTQDEKYPLVFVVRDRIIPTSENYERVFLLHSVEPPKIEADGTAIITNMRRTLTQNRGIFTGQYDGKLFLKSISPAKAEMRLVKGHRVGSQQFDAQKPLANGEEGWGRLEIAENNTKITEFLNVMVTMDSETAPPEILAVNGEGIVGCQLLNLVVVWVDPTVRKATHLSFNLDRGAERLLICAIAPFDGKIELPNGDDQKISASKERAVITILNVGAGLFSIEF
jgi:hypothetical protein